MQRAIRKVRSNAEILDIRPDRIAVHGSSAGGILSALSAVHYDHGHKESGDPIEQVSCRPDGVILSYGAFSLTVPLQEGLGSILADPDIREKHYSSPDKFVTPDTPPFFMWQTPDEDDPRLMCNMVRALTEAGVRCEAHLFPFGPHGTGMADGQNPMNYNDIHVARWSDLAIEWLRLYGF